MSDGFRRTRSLIPVRSGERTLRWLTALLVAFVAVAGLTGCSSTTGKGSGADAAGSSSPQPLTEAQSQRLSVARFNAYRAGTVAVTGTVVGDQSVTINGWVDTTKGRGYALVQAPNATNPGAFLTEWTAQQISAQDYRGTKPPMPPPDSGWQTTTLDPHASVLAAAQALLVSLSSDRPENAQLLRQNGAQWLGSATVDGKSVDIMSGPTDPNAASKQSSLRYWVDGDGNLLRVQALFDGVHQSTLDLSDAKNVSF